MTNVKIYTSPGCSYCIRAKHLLTSLGATYQEVNFWDDLEAFEKLRHQHEWNTLPMIFINGEFVGGYDDIASLHAAGRLKEKLNS